MDRSEQAKTADALWDRAMFEGLFESAPDAIIVVDSGGQIVRINTQTEVMFGYERLSLIGEPIEILIPNRYKGQHTLHRAAYAMDPHTRPMHTGLELFGIRKDGTEFPVEVSLAPLQIRDAHFALSIIRDRTEPVQAELALKMIQAALGKAHDELERRVQERTAELAKANEDLQAEIAEHARAERRIKASLEEKEVLLREIHHRVKNNLQVITSLLNLQSRTICDETVLAVLRESRNRVKSMALVHELLYQSKDLAEVEFGKYLQLLTGQLSISYGTSAADIGLKVNARDIRLDIDTAIPCGLIVSELVSNSLKHAFPGGRKGRIDIDLQSTGNRRFILTVRDNGIGMREDEIEPDNTSSLGLRLVKSLSDQLRGTVEIRNDNGTEFKIAFEAVKYDKRI